MGQKISGVTDKQHISMLHSLPSSPLFFSSGEIKIQAWKCLPAQLILAEEYDCGVWGAKYLNSCCQNAEGGIYS